MHLTIKINLKNFLIIYTTVFFGCTQPGEGVTETFIVPADTMPVYKTTGNHPPPPPPIRAYYFPSNFIFDTSGQIFFYQQEEGGWFCGTGIEWNTPPEFIDLKPKDIIQIPVDNIETFIELNILKRDSSDRYVIIASTADTIKSAGLSKVISIFKNKLNKIRWKFRKVTQEETIVLDYKKRQANYYPDGIKWDSTKTLFLPKLDNVIKFTPPKVEDE